MLSCSQNACTCTTRTSCLSAGLHLCVHVLHAVPHQRLQLQQAGATRNSGPCPDAGESVLVFVFVCVCVRVCV